MQKTSEAIFNVIIEHLLYFFVFLTPIFILPFTNFPVPASKRLFCSVLVFLLLALWALKTMVLGELKIRWQKATPIFLAFLAILAVSSAISGVRAQSFWGFSLESDAFFSFLLYFLIFFLFSNLLENEKQVLRTLKIFFASCFVLLVFFFVSVFLKESSLGGFFLLNPVGRVQALGILFGANLIGLMVLLSQKARAWQKRSLFLKTMFVAKVVAAVLCLAAVILINFWALWVVLGLACLLLILMELIRREGGAERGFNKGVALPALVLALALLFLFLEIPSHKLVGLPVEPNLSYGESFGVAKNTILQGLDKFLLGSGPATFAYDYDLFHSKAVNLTDFWQARFGQGVNIFLTLLATSGVLGAAFALVFTLFFGFCWLKTVFKSDFLGKKQNHPDHPEVFVAEMPYIKAITLILAFYFLVVWFFYSANFVLMFASFLTLGLWETLAGKGREKLIEFDKIGVQRVFLIMIICIFVMVGCLAGLYEVGKNYAGDVLFARGMGIVNSAGNDLGQGIEKINKAAEFVKKDIYFRSLSQVLLVAFERVWDDTALSLNEKRETLQGIISNVESSLNEAAQINPLDAQNWLQLGNAYQIFFLKDIAGTGELAILAYQEARECAPQDPQIPLAIAGVYFRAAQRINQQLIDLENAQIQIDKEALLQSRQDNFNQALKEVESALRLKPDFGEAQKMRLGIQQTLGQPGF